MLALLSFLGRAIEAGGLTESCTCPHRRGRGRPRPATPARFLQAGRRLPQRPSQARPLTG